jgi:hypothetical protein
MLSINLGSICNKKFFGTIAWDFLILFRIFFFISYLFYFIFKYLCYCFMEF